jgi:hypothetical protein
MLAMNWIFFTYNKVAFGTRYGSSTLTKAKEKILKLFPTSNLLICLNQEKHSLIDELEQVVRATLHVEASSEV